MKPLVILTGPTAAGKTALSVELAKAVNGEIISADSMQVYRGMNIGSAKVTPEEMQGIKHYLIDAYDIDEEFNVVEFQRAAKEAMEEIYSRGKLPIITGGTGFYIQALLRDIDFTENHEDTSYRQELFALAESEGADKLHAMLEAADPEAAAAIHKNNIIKTVRALEYYRQTDGQKISEHNRLQQQKKSPYNYAYFVLTRDRAQLYERIDRRVDRMMEEGLLEEVRGLRAAGARRDMISMLGLGYKELLAYLDGETDLDTAVSLIKEGSRHYARRQLTWFRREKDVIYLDAGEYSMQELLQNIQKILTEKGIISEV